MSRSTAVGATGAALLMSVGTYAVLALYAGSWSELRPAKCMPDDCFCEAIRPGPVRQPANTASGLLFLPVAAGLVALAYSRRSRSALSDLPLILRRPLYVWIFAGATSLTGLGTAFYHASLSFAGQTVDVLGMYLVATFAVLYAAARVWRLPDPAAGLLYILGNGILLWSLIVVPEARRYLFAALILLALCLEYAVRARGRMSGEAGHLVAAVAVLAVGFGVWILDITQTVCVPGSLLQGHAIWHAAAAASLAFVFLYYVSESAGR
jgi:hypothetical protein